jgi:hypothetical protein
MIRAMARLVHSNVVAIPDVGTVDDQVFIEMKFVDGKSPRDWLGAAERPWSKILAVFTDAGVRDRARQRTRTNSTRVSSLG